MRKVDANLLLVRREGKEAQEVLQEEQAANSLMGRIGTDSEAEPLSEEKFIREVFSIFIPSDIYIYVSLYDIEYLATSELTQSHLKNILFTSESLK